MNNIVSKSYKGVVLVYLQRKKDTPYKPNTFCSYMKNNTTPKTEKEN